MKKLLFGGIAVIGLATLILGPRAVCSHASHLIGMAQKEVNDGIPLEYQIDRLEGMLEDFGPKITQAKLDVAKGQVEVEGLEREIARLRQDQDAAKVRLKVQADRLNGAERTSFVIAGREYSKDRLNRELSLDFGRFKQRAAILEMKTKQLDAQRTAVEAALSRVEAAGLEKNELETRISGMRAELTQIKAMESASRHYNLDDSDLARANQLADRISKRLAVAQKFIENEAVPTSTLQEELGRTSTSIADEVDAYLGSESEATRMNVSAPGSER